MNRKGRIGRKERNGKERTRGEAKRCERGNRGVRNRGYGERETSKVEEMDTGKRERTEYEAKDEREQKYVNGSMGVRGKGKQNRRL